MVFRLRMLHLKISLMEKFSHDENSTNRGIGN